MAPHTPARKTKVPPQGTIDRAPTPPASLSHANYGTRHGAHTDIDARRWLGPMAAPQHRGAEAGVAGDLLVHLASTGATDVGRGYGDCRRHHSTVVLDCLGSSGRITVARNQDA